MTCLDETDLIVWESQAAAVPLLLWAWCSALWCAKFRCKLALSGYAQWERSPFSS